MKAGFVSINRYSMGAEYSDYFNPGLAMEPRSLTVGVYSVVTASMNAPLQ